MALVLADRVQETTNTTGTGAITLAGAVTGYQSFSVVGNGNTTYYTITDGTNWEVGLGTYSTTGPTLTRTTILSSSNANAAINVTAGSKVFCGYPASKSVNQDGMIATGSYNSSFSDGIVVDYDAVGSNGRISVGTADNISFYNGGVAGSLLGKASSNGNWTFYGFVTLGNGTPLGGATNPLLASISSANNYVQGYIQNTQSGISSSADFVTYADNSSDAHGWADMGYTSSVYADTTYTVTGANEAYLFGSGSTGTAGTGNLVYATDSTGTQNYHQWYVGGFTQAKSAYKMQLTSTTLNLPVQVVSTVATGTAPFSVASTTPVTNLSIGGNAATATTATTATNATNVANTGAVSTAASYYPTFVANNTTSNQGLNTTAGLSFNPSTNVLSPTAVSLSAGTATRAPIVLASGTNLTTAAAGSMEFDGVALYMTPFGTSRGSVPSYQIEVLSANYTLTSQTGAQKLLNATTNGAVAVTTGLYEFECHFFLTGMSATAGTFGFALAGTATYTQFWMASAAKSGTTATAITAGNANAMYTTMNTAANTAITGSSTNTAGGALIKGFVRVTVAGTIIPQVSLSVASAAVVQAGSYFKITPVSATSTATTVGNWS